MLNTLLTGALIAISFSAPPGPVAFETIRRGLRGGFRAALSVQLGSIVGDTAWCAAALFGLAPLAAIPWLRAVLGIAGVVVLVWLGAAGLLEALWPAPPAQEDVTTKTQRHEGARKSALGALVSSWLRGNDGGTGAFRSGMAISLANPMAIGYWVSIGGVMLAAGVAGTSAAQTAAFVAGFVAGTFAWAFLMAFCFRWLEGVFRSSGRLARGVTALCGLALIALGLGLGWQALSALL